jgi:RNA polymerase sigma-70 factor (ECF subfamily)
MPLPSLMTVMHTITDPRASARSVPREDAAVLPSFRAVYEDYFDFVWTCARRMGVPADAIDDVVQEVFITVHGRLCTLERPASLRSWLYGVVRRTVSTYHRGRNTRTARESPALDIDEATNPMQLSPLDLAVLGDELKLLWGLIAELDAPKREVLILAEFEEMTAPEIAEAVAIPLNTAYSRLRAARQEFNLAFARAAARRKPRK